MAIDAATVRRVAHLARIKTPEDRLEPLAAELNGILAWIEQLNEVDVTGVEATDNPLKAVNVTRPDEIVPCLTQQQALAGAPRAEEGRFAVPQILGESR